MMVDSIGIEAVMVLVEKRLRPVSLLLGYPPQLDRVYVRIVGESANALGSEKRRSIVPTSSPAEPLLQPSRQISK